MALRKRIAERLSGLDRTTGETPILDEVAVPATVVAVSGFNLPLTQGLAQGGILQQLQGFEGFPSFAWGTAVGNKAGQWYTVFYPHTIKGAVPVAIAQGRLTNINFREIVRVAREDYGEQGDFNSDYYCKLVAQGARDRVNQLAPPWPLNLVWDFIVGGMVYWGFYAAWLVSGWILNVLWDVFIQKQIDNVRDAVNLRLNDLYAMWGIPTNMAVTPLHIRNASDTGFEFQSFGQVTCYWIAIGRR